MTWLEGSPNAAEQAGEWEMAEKKASETCVAQVARFVASVGIGNRFTKLQLIHAVSGFSQADRRMRDLRQLGWQIDNYRENPNLRPSEYLLVRMGTRIDLGERPRARRRRTISGPKRRRIFERDGHTCQVCGIPAGAAFLDAPETKAQLTIGHITPVSRGGPDDDYNLRAECQRCGDQSRDVTIDPPTKEEILTQISYLGAMKRKRRLYGWMQAGRRTFDDAERLFNEWSRLSPPDRAAVQEALGRQVLKDI